MSEEPKSPAVLPLLLPLARLEAPPLAHNGPSDASPAHAYLARLRSPAGQRVQGAALSHLARLLTRGGRPNPVRFPWASLRYEHVLSLQARLAHDYAPATVNRHLAALRGVLREAWRLDQMTSKDFRRAIDVKDIPIHRDHAAGRMLSTTEVDKLYAAARAGVSPKIDRDVAVLTLALAAGLRRDELAGLVVKDYAADVNAVHVRHGKGNKPRTVYVGEDARELLAPWCSLRAKILGTEGPLLVSLSCTGKLLTHALTASGVYDLLQRLGVRADVAEFTPHDLRRTFISTLWETSGDGPAIQKLAGHENLNTTARYDRRGDHAMRRAAETIKLPKSVESGESSGGEKT